MQDPLQIYYSTTVFAPAASPARTQVGNGVPRWMQKFPKVDDHWRSPLALTTGSRVVAVGFVPGGNRLVSASEGGTIKVWDICTGRILSQKELPSRIDTARFSADCRLLASVGNKKLTLWDVLSGQEIHVLPVAGRGRTPHCPVFSPDGKRLAWHTGDGLHWHISDRLILCDSEKGSCLKEYDVAFISYAVFSPDGRQLAFVVNSRVLVWDTTSEKKPKKLGKLPFSFPLYSETVRSFVTAAYFPDGKQLIACWGRYGGTSCAVGLWNTESGQLIKELTNPPFMVNAAAFSPDCTLLALFGSESRATLWNLESGDMERLPKGVFRQHKGQRQESLLFSPDRKQLAACSHDTVIFWSIRARNEHETFLGHGNAVTGVELSPNGRQLASASNDMRIKLWDPYSGKETKRLSGHTDPITAMTFSPDGIDLVTASADDTIRFWNTISGEEEAKLSRFGRSINTMAFSPNGTQLLWASPEGGVCEISWRRNRNYIGRGILRFSNKPKKLKDVTSSVTTVAFSVDGEQQAFGSEDGIVRLRNTASKKLTLLEVQGARISAVAFLPDGKQLAVASSDKVVALWDVISGLQLQKVTLLAPLSSLKISSDGQSMETDRGTFNLHAFFSGSQQSGQNPPGNIFFAGEWIYRGSQRLLWLPHEYRGRCWVVRGNLVVIGQELGAVTFLEFRDEVVD
jgi:WD40 repeat protein